MTSFPRYFPWLVVGLAAVYLLGVGWPTPHEREGMRLASFAVLPVQEGGRVKPLDTLARNHLMVISNRSEYRDDKGDVQPAIRWMLDVMGTSWTSDQDKLFRIDDPQVQQALELPPRQPAHYSLQEIRGKLSAWMKKSMAQAQEDPHRPDPLREKIAQAVVLPLEFYEKVERFSTDHKVFRIENTEVQGLLGLRERPGLRYAFSEFVYEIPKLIRQSERARGVDPKKRSVFQAQVLEMMNKVNRYLEVADYQRNLALIPPLSDPEQTSWLSIQAVQAQSSARRGHAEGEKQELTPEEKAAATLNLTVLSYVAAASPRLGMQEQGTKAYGEYVGEYHKQLAEAGFIPLEKVRFEEYYNQAAPFYHCAVLYVLIFVLAVCSWLGWSEPLRRGAFWLLVLTLTVHTAALTGRMFLQGRPPVTNLYSSAVFIGWGCVLLCLFLERLFPYALATAVAGSFGFLTTIVAIHLAASGDTMEMMRAVLDTNFWLATHVTTVTLGYTATFVAGFLGIAYIVMGVLTRSLDKNLQQALSKMIYGVICFATFLSFVGTVLGGIWADQSWGRFWGWDPKENGAVLIVIWNALILHARWGGMIKQRGMAILAVAGNMVTGWSWFGTNQLGIGLHAYGFNNTLALGLTIFWASQLLVIGLGLIPQTSWRSFSLPELKPAPVKAVPDRGKRDKVPSTAITQAGPGYQERAGGLCHGHDGRRHLFGVGAAGTPESRRQLFRGQRGCRAGYPCDTRRHVLAAAFLLAGAEITPTMGCEERSRPLAREVSACAQTPPRKVPPVSRHHPSSTPGWWPCCLHLCAAGWGT